MTQFFVLLTLYLVYSSYTLQNFSVYFNGRNVFQWNIRLGKNCLIKLQIYFLTNFSKTLRNSSLFNIQNSTEHILAALLSFHTGIEIPSTVIPRQTCFLYTYTKIYLLLCFEKKFSLNQNAKFLLTENFRIVCLDAANM